MASELGLKDRVVWTGMIEGAVKWGAFRSAEVFILPSHQENFGLAVAEALACETPVLISNKVNIWREIAGDKAGVDAMLAEWAALSEAERGAMRRNALDCFQTHFQMETLLRRLDQLFSPPGSPGGR